MSSWVRLWHDMPTDPKFRTIARASGQPLSVVISVFVFMLCDAGTQANADERGRTLANDEDIASALDIDDEAVALIRQAMQGRVLDGDMLTGWEKRQPRREDNSAERARAWREGRKAERMRTQTNAEKRPDADTDTDSDIPPIPPKGDTSSDAQASATPDPVEKPKPRRSIAGDFAAFWERYPHKVGKHAAEKAFEKALRQPGVTLEALLAGVWRYVETKPPDRAYCNPATWLNQGRWNDAPAAAPTQGRAAAPAPRRNVFMQLHDDEASRHDQTDHRPGRGSGQPTADRAERAHHRNDPPPHERAATDRRSPAIVDICPLSGEPI